MRISLVLALSILAGCGGSAAPTPEACADICAQEGDAAPADEAAEAAEAPASAGASDVKLTQFQADLLASSIEDIAGGVRPFEPTAIGICKGQRTCDEFVGTDVGELPEGDYIIKAELRVPNHGDPGTWKVQFSTSCTTTRTTDNGESSSSSESSREYDVRYAGKERGYRLMPLRTIQSPSQGGKRECTYTITAPHPDGDKVYGGSWSVPDAG